MHCINHPNWTNHTINLGPVQTPLHSCAEPNWMRFDFGATLVRLLIQTAYCVSNLMWILNTDKAKGLGPTQFSRHYSTFKMVGMKERIAPIKDISRGYQRRTMFFESLQMYVALRRRGVILLLSLTGLLLFSRNQNTATDTVHLRSCRRQVGHDVEHVYRWAIQENFQNLLINLVRHMWRAPYESVAAPVSNNAADLVELNNVAAPN